MKISFSILIRFMALAGGIAALAAWYTASRLCSPLDPSSAWRPVVFVALALVWSFPILRLLTMGLGGFRRLSHAGFYFLGLGAMLLMALLAMDLSGLLLRLVGLAWPVQTPWFLSGLCLLLSLLGLRTALKIPGVELVAIPHKNLHPDLQGLKIVQISDLHISGMLGRAYVQGVVDEAMAQKPDLIAITGDLVDGPRSTLQDSIVPLAGLKAPLGVHYVTGNHEYTWGARGWIQDFKALGFNVLENAHSVLKRGRASLLVIGINDLSAGRFGSGDRADAQQAVQGAPKADFTLFLAHQPGAWPMAQAVGSDLMLAGHTHAGQFFPFQGIVALFHKYFRGLYRHEGEFWVYVNSGAGFWGPPNRLGVPTEITLLELSAA